MTTPEHAPQTPEHPPVPGQPPVPQDAPPAANMPTMPPMPEKPPVQPFTFGVEIKGDTRHIPEEIRALIGREVMSLVLGLGKDHGFTVTDMNVTHNMIGAGALDQNPAEAGSNEQTPADATVEASEETPEPSLFTPETQEKFDTPISETFYSDEDVKVTNAKDAAAKAAAEAEGEGSKAQGLAAVTEKFAKSDELAPLSDERRREFVEALREQGVVTVRHAAILGLDTVRDMVSHLRPKLKGKQRFDSEVMTLTQGIIDALSDDAYNVLSDEGGTIDGPLDFAEIAKFCNSPSQIPAGAVRNATKQEFGEFPESWEHLTLAQVIDQTSRHDLEQSALSDDGLSPDQIEKCFAVANSFAEQLTGKQ